MNDTTADEKIQVFMIRPAHAGEWLMFEASEFADTMNQVFDPPTEGKHLDVEIKWTWLTRAEIEKAGEFGGW